MPIEHGFRFKIIGEVFIPRKSTALADVVEAQEQITEAREKVQAALGDVPADFALGDIVASSRRAPEVAE